MCRSHPPLSAPFTNRRHHGPPPPSHITHTLRSSAEGLDNMRDGQSDSVKMFSTSGAQMTSKNKPHLPGRRRPSLMCAYSSEKTGTSSGTHRHRFPTGIFRAVGVALCSSRHEGTADGDGAAESTPCFKSEQRLQLPSLG